MGTKSQATNESVIDRVVDMNTSKVSNNLNESKTNWFF